MLNYPRVVLDNMNMDGRGVGFPKKSHVPWSSQKCIAGCLGSGPVHVRGGEENSSQSQHEVVELEFAFGNR